MSEASQPTPLHDLNSFRRDILTVAAGMTDPHGLGIKSELEDAYGKEIHHGRLYPALNELVDKGLMEKGSKDRRTNKYNVTPRGHRELDAHQTWRADALGGDA